MVSLNFCDLSGSQYIKIVTRQSGIEGLFLSVLSYCGGSKEGLRSVIG